MKKLLFILFSTSVLTINAQKQISVLTDWGIRASELHSDKFYKQVSIGILYRQKQNTFALKYDIIDFRFRNFTFRQLYNVIGGTAAYYRHFNKKRLSGFNAGLSVSYLQFSSSWYTRQRYNSPPTLTINCFGDYEYSRGRTQYRQLSIVPSIGYEYYPVKNLSLFVDLGYGVLLSNSEMNYWNDTYGHATPVISNKAAGNLNFNIGIKTVIWRSKKLKTWNEFY